MNDGNCQNTPAPLRERRLNVVEKMKPVLGIIGGIGSGKSAVAAELVRRGGAVVAGDPLGHEGLRLPDLKQRVVARWGPGILKPDGDVDRRKLGHIVFNNP